MPAKRFHYCATDEAAFVWEYTVGTATSTLSYYATSSAVLHPSIFSLSDADKASSGKAVKNYRVKHNGEY